MAETFQALQGWLRRNLAWSNSRQSWQERIAVLLLLIGAGLLVWLHGAFSFGMLMALWAGLVLVGAVLLRRGWLKLFGPVLFYDLVRMSRRKRHMLVRWGYVALLGLLIGWFCLIWYWQPGPGGRREMTRNDVVQLNEVLYYTFMIMQFVMVLLVTPAYVAGAIAEEKERKTLEFLLATDLRNREIVLSKLLARLFTILLIILAALPILSILQVLGGVGPDLVLGGFAATVLTVIGLAGLSIACSAVTRRSRDAILLTYLGMFVYCVLSVTLYVCAPLPSVAAVLRWPGNWGSRISLRDCQEWFCCGNPILLTIDLFRGSGGNVSAALPTVLPRYLIFHAVAGVLFPAWAVWRLRAIALKESYGTTARLPMFSRLFGRPAVGPAPMLWKELFVESSVKVGAVLRVIMGIIIVILVLVSFWWPVALIYQYFEWKEQARTLPQQMAEKETLERKRDGLLMEGKQLSRDEQRRLTRLQNQQNGSYYYLGRMNPERRLAEQSSWWVRVVGTMVAMLMLLFVAVRAAGSITGEKDKQTFNELLASPLSSDSILFAKWFGAMAGVRWSWLWLVSIWVLGAIMGGLHILAIPLLLVSWVVYAFGAAGVGMWFSAYSRTSLSAIVWTVLVLALVGVGHWLLVGAICYTPLGCMGRGTGDTLKFMEYLMKFELGQTPPFVLGWFALTGEEFNSGYFYETAVHFTIASVVGLATWIVFTLALGTRLVYSFRKMTNRLATMQPGRGSDEVRKRVSPGWSKRFRSETIQPRPPVRGDEIAEVLPADEYEVDEGK